MRIIDISELKINDYFPSFNNLLLKMITQLKFSTITK